MPVTSYLIGYRDDNRRVKYYLCTDVRKGRAVCGPKKGAPRFDLQMGEMIMRQLPAVDARKCQLVEAKDRCAFVGNGIGELSALDMEILI